MGSTQSWPALPGTIDPTYAASVTAALSAKADTATVNTQLAAEADVVDVVSGAAALRLLNQEFGIAVDFVAKSAAIRDPDGTRNRCGIPSSCLTASRASTATYIGYDRLVKTAGVDQIRYSWHPTTGVARGALFEMAATNLLTRSEDFGDVSWSKSSTSVNSNVAVAPDGNTTADEVYEIAANADHSVMKVAGTITAGSVCCASVWVKRGSGTRNFRIFLSNSGASSGVICMFDLAAETAGTITTTGTGVAGYARIIKHVNGWYRCSLSGIVDTTGTAPKVYFHVINDTTLSYLGDGTSSLYLWGAQMETAIYAPTSYIPTVAATANRSADIAPYALVSSFSFDPSQVTLSAEWENPIEFYPTSTSPIVAAICDNTSGNRVSITQRIEVATQHSVYASVVVGGSPTAYGSSVAYTFGSIARAAVAARANDFGAAYNGVLQAADTSGDMPAGMTHLILGATSSSSSFGRPLFLRKVMATLRRRSDSELAAL